MAGSFGQNRFFQKGLATFYADKFEGRKTASGEPFTQMGFTAAHRTLPLGSWVKVTNSATLRSVVVRINDRGPFSKGRIIDLSKRAAFEIGMLDHGKTTVFVEVVDHPQAESFLLKFAPALDNKGIIKKVSPVVPKPVF
jgi:rare lipoprotein A